MDAAVRGSLAQTLGDNAAGFDLADAVAASTNANEPTGGTTNQSGLPVFSHDEIAHQLTHAYWQFFGESPHKFDVATGGTLFADISGLTEAGKQLAKWALQAWTNVSGILFSFVNSHPSQPDPHILFDDDDSGAWSTYWSSGGTTISAFINVSKEWLADYGTSIDSYSFSTYIHEIGHALGLGHAGNYNGAATYGVDNHYLNDSWQASVMSYFSQTENTYIKADFAEVVTPMIADIVAIHDLYGTPTNLRAGNTRYGESSTAGGYLDRLVDLEGPIAFTIIDSGGIDWIDLRSVQEDQRINLGHGHTSDVLGLKGNMSIAPGTVIEHVISGHGDDRIIGNAADNRIKAGPGDDTVAGWGGDDSVHGGFDRDLLDGNGGNDLLKGGGGADRLDGGIGDDVLQGGAHADTLLGGSGADTLHGGGGHDLMLGGPGSDELVGGGGNDTLRGGTGRDLLIGGPGSEALAGGGGNDTLRGGTGRDTLNGEPGDDRLFGGAGADTQIFKSGYGSDRIFGFQDDIDTIRLDADLWGGGLSPQQVVNRHGSVSNGDAVLDFGGGDVLTFVDFTGLAALVDDIVII